MFDKIKAWVVRQYRQISTKLGAILTLLSALANQLAPNLTAINSTWGDYATKAGAVVGILLVLWNEDKGNAPPAA